MHDAVRFVLLRVFYLGLSVIPADKTSRSFETRMRATSRKTDIIISPPFVRYRDGLGTDYVRYHDFYCNTKLISLFLLGTMLT